MAKEYLETLQSLLLPVVLELPADIDIAVRHFFGGAAAYANGRICISLTTVGLAMKLPEESRGQLLKQGARPLRYFPNAPEKKEYVLVPPGFRDDGERLKLWARRSIDHVLTLPQAKTRKRRIEGP